MAHSSIFNHRKLKRLARELEADLPTALGCLEFLWNYAADHHVDGDITSMTDDEVADAAKWSGDHNRFVDACCKAGFLDRERRVPTLFTGSDDGPARAGEPSSPGEDACRPGRLNGTDGPNERTLRVHDWLDWCPDYVKDRLADIRSKASPRTCPTCGTVFNPRRADALYCCNRCRKAAYDTKNSGNGSERIRTFSDGKNNRTEPKSAQKRTTEPDPEAQRPEAPRSAAVPAVRAESPPPVSPGGIVLNRVASGSGSESVFSPAGGNGSGSGSSEGLWQRASMEFLKGAKGDFEKGLRGFADSVLAALKPDHSTADVNDLIAFALHVRSVLRSNKLDDWVRAMGDARNVAVMKAQTGGQYGSWRTEMTYKFGKWSVKTK